MAVGRGEMAKLRAAQSPTVPTMASPSPALTSASTFTVPDEDVEHARPYGGGWRNDPYHVAQRAQDARSSTPALGPSESTTPDPLGTANGNRNYYGGRSAFQRESTRIVHSISHGNLRAAFRGVASSISLPTTNPNSSAASTHTVHTIPGEGSAVSDLAYGRKGLEIKSINFKDYAGNKYPSEQAYVPRYKQHSLRPSKRTVSIRNFVNRRVYGRPGDGTNVLIPNIPSDLVIPGVDYDVNTEYDTTKRPSNSSLLSLGLVEEAEASVKRWKMEERRAKLNARLNSLSRKFSGTYNDDDDDLVPLTPSPPAPRNLKESVKKYAPASYDRMLRRDKANKVHMAMRVAEQRQMAETRARWKREFAEQDAAEKKRLQLAEQAEAQKKAQAEQQDKAERQVRLEELKKVREQKLQMFMEQHTEGMKRQLEKEERIKREQTAWMEPADMEEDLYNLTPLRCQFGYPMARRAAGSAAHGVASTQPVVPAVASVQLVVPAVASTQPVVPAVASVQLVVPAVASTQPVVPAVVSETVAVTSHQPDMSGETSASTVTKPTASVQPSTPTVVSEAADVAPPQPTTPIVPSANPTAPAVTSTQSGTPATISDTAPTEHQDEETYYDNKQADDLARTFESKL
jgi:hypothetical protein